MKKLFLCSIIFILFLTGCAKQNEMNTDQILNGDFSSVVGTYTNPKGEKVQLDADGLRWNERQTSDIRCGKSGVCTMGIHVAGQGEGGYALTIYPAGIEIEGLTTNTDKVRICYGQAEPMSEDEIYTFTSDKIEPVPYESDYQSFISKEYYDVLYELASPYGLLNPHIEANLLTINGVDICVEFHDDVNFYNLTLSKDIDYVKGEPKRAEVILTVSCYLDQELAYNGKLVTNDGQSFFITYDDINETIINNNDTSDSFGQPIQFVDSLHSQLIDVFEEAKKITECHSSVLSVWEHELSEVRNMKKGYDEIKNARDIEITSKKTTELLNQAFEEKHYHDVLNQCFRNYFKLNEVQIREHSISLKNEHDSIYYNSNGQYLQQLEESISYTKNEQEKNALLKLSASRTSDLQVSYEGELYIYYGDTFYLRYDPVNQVLLDNEAGSKTYGQPTKLVSSLNQKLIAVFKTAQTATELQYPILSEWMNQARSVQNGTKTATDIKDAYDIVPNLNVLDIEFETSMDDFVMTDPCASAMEITRSFLYSARKAIFIPDITNDVTDETIFYDALLTIGFDGNEHYPYTHLVRRNEDALFVWTLKDMKKYAYEVYGHDFKPYIHEEWSSMYKPALERYESWLEFGLVGEGPETFRIENMYAEQIDEHVFVYFDLVWFEVDDNWAPAEITKIQHSVSEYQLMSENGHTFLRHIHTDFGE